MWHRLDRLSLLGVVGVSVLALIALWLTRLEVALADRQAAALIVTSPTLVSYQGRVLANGMPFNGTG